MGRKRAQNLVRSFALPDGVALYTEASYALALRRPTGEVVVRRGSLVPARPLPGRRERPWAIPRTISVLVAALQFGHGQAGKLATADVGAQSLATAAEGRYPEQRRRQTLFALCLGLFVAPFCFALWPTAACHIARAACCLLAPGEGASVGVLAWVEGTAALLFVPLYVRVLRLSSSWRRLFRYHAAGHQVRAAFAAGLPLREATARTMHPQQPDCMCSASLVAALLAAGMSHVWESALPALEMSLSATTMRLLLVGPALLFAMVLRGALPRTHRPARRQRQAWAAARVNRACLPVADEPNDGEREVALCAMVALCASDEPEARPLRPALAWQRLAGATE